jgi:hypothetical protein
MTITPTPAANLVRDDVIGLGGDLVRVIGVDASEPLPADPYVALVTEDLTTREQFIDYVRPDRVFHVAR